MTLAPHLARGRELMDFSFLKALISPAKWLYALCVDQTRISVLVPYIKGWPEKLIPVQDKGGLTGLVLFSVTTQSKRPVEITRISVDHAATLQLRDPGNRGFFIGGSALDEELPFRMMWEGSVHVRADLQQLFALAATFPDSTQEQRIRVSIHARRSRAYVGGFEGFGRARVTAIEFHARLTTEQVLGTLLPPKCSVSTPQPFLIEGAVTVAGGPGPFVVHERLADGSVSTKSIELLAGRGDSQQRSPGT